MSLSKEAKRKLVAAGFNDADIADVEKATAEPNPGRRGSRRKVAILEGDAADSFLERWFGGSDSDETPETEGDDDAGDDEGTDDEETDDADTGDDKPDSTVGYFRERRTG